MDNESSIQNKLAFQIIHCWPHAASGFERIKG